MATFLALVEGLIGDPAEKAAFAADPDNYLAQRGFGDLDDDDVRTALAHSAETFPPRLAATIDPEGGLEPLVDVDLQHLGLSSFDDFVPPLEDDLGGGEVGVADVADDALGTDEHARDDGQPDEVGNGQEQQSRGLDRDVDIDIDGEPPALPSDATAPAEVAQALTAEPAPAAGSAGAGGAADVETLPTDLVEPAADDQTFGDPFVDADLHVDDDAPWMDQPDADSGLDQFDEPDDDILDDVDDHFGA